jgi:hypothetical protein
VLSGKFWHEIEKHATCFCACAVLTQFSLAIGSKQLFLVAHEYVDLAEDTVGEGAGAGDVVAAVTVDDDDDFI